jgi:LETM1 and EF-hand domain-containing protein 1
MLTHRASCGLLNHHQMEELKKKLFTDREKTLLLKTKFILKEAKYTIVQGSKDLWNDIKWITNLYKTKVSYEFTGYELAESHRIKIDMIKFIPYSVILVVPFAELSLPIILWLYPNAVPSFYLFDTAWDQRIERCEQVQFESHKFLIDRLTEVMSKQLKIEQFEFNRYEFFKEGFFEVIDDLDKHLDYRNFNSDELIKVLEFLGGGDFVDGTTTFNKIVNLFTLNIPRLIVKICRWVFAKITRRKLAPYTDPRFVRGNF